MQKMLCLAEYDTFDSAFIGVVFAASHPLVLRFRYYQQPTYPGRGEEGEGKELKR